MLPIRRSRVINRGFAAASGMLVVAAIAVGSAAAQAPPTQDAPNGSTEPSPALTEKRTRPFEFGLIGDTRYTEEQKAKFENLLAEMNGEKLAFVAHDGDIKGGSDPCTDEIFTETFDLFEQFDDPLVYTPGDNEWTDCHRTGGDPLERLDFLRETFYPSEESLGLRTITLERQSESYPENARWGFGGVVFATVHVVGSNNNLPDAANPVGDAAEYAARNEANLAWLDDTFALAADNGALGVMVIMQANPGFELPPEERTGFNDTLASLEAHTLAFERPVVLVHGDSHYFRMDKPMIGSISGRRVENFTRLETFGTDDVHWVRATIDPSDAELFTFREEIVDANLVDHTVPSE